MNVSCPRRPPSSTYTDTNGYFHLKATRNFHFGYVAGGGDWPRTKANPIEISYTGFESNGLTPDMIRGIDAGDILLKPKQ